MTTDLKYTKVLETPESLSKLKEWPVVSAFSRCQGAQSQADSMKSQGWNLSPRRFFCLDSRSHFKTLEYVFDIFLCFPMTGKINFL